ncbi:MAG: protein-glutamate O-methyltransferase CheR [Spongiibacteraceae bacterium]|nr:protein-glutamate O-methyltransferase CheR [Spongiibacteraceae bacterium]
MAFTITDQVFLQYSTFLQDKVGICLREEKKTLLIARLSKRLRHYQIDSFKRYFDIVMGNSHPGEEQMMIDLLTTNETYFFREPHHFDYLKNEVLSKHKHGKSFRIRSAASSTGEEAYSIAMLLADHFGLNGWEIIGSDVSSRVLKTAKRGKYLMDRIDGIPKNNLKKYCLKGFGSEEGSLLIDNTLRDNVNFSQINLKSHVPDLGLFDVIFLRNILIYFDMETKRLIVKRVLSLLKPGGIFFIGHSETLKGVNESVKLLAATTYKKTGS